MTIFENDKTSEIYLDTIEELQSCPKPILAKYFDQKIKELFRKKNPKIILLTESEVKKLSDEMWDPSA